MTLLLDTHIWLWLSEDAPRLTGTIARAARKAAREGNLLVSPISAWEIAMLQAKGRLELGVPVEHWLARALDFPGLNVAILTPQIAAASCFLPGLTHADPADRILIATAQANGAALATADQRILDYAKDGHLTVLE